MHTIYLFPNETPELFQGNVADCRTPKTFLGNAVKHTLVLDIHRHPMLIIFRPFQFFRNTRNIIQQIIVFLHYFSTFASLLQIVNFRTTKMITAMTARPPACPKLRTPERSTKLATVLPLIVTTARTASKIPTSPSPAIIPEQQSTPLLITLSLFALPS